MYNCYFYLCRFKSVWIGELNSTKEIVYGPQETTSNCYGHNLIIQKNTLKQSESYTFKLLFKFAGTLSESQSRIQRHTSQTPHGGGCEFKG